MSTALDRREILLGLLGASAASVLGCRPTPPALPQAGEIVGAAHELGHRLRTAASISLPDEQFQQTEVVIVGAGVAGLAAARRLKHAGVDDFVVLELESVAGGTSRAGSSGKFSFPWGAHYLPAPRKENAPLVKLLDDFGVVAKYGDDGEPHWREEMLVRDPEERLFVNGQWHEGLWPTAIATAEDDRNLIAFQRQVQQWVRWRDGQGRRAFTLPVSACSDDAEAVEFDRMSFADWLDERKLNSRLFRWWLEYATRDDYGTTLAQTSAWAGLFYFASRVHHDVTEPQPLLTWPEGNGWLVKQLLTSVQTRLRTGYAVAMIQPREQGQDVIAVDERGKVTGYRSQHVIFAAPQFLAPYVIRDLPEQRVSDAKSFAYGAWLVANLHLSQRPQNVGFEPCWDNVLLDSPSLGYVSATHQRGRDHGPTVWTYYLPLVDDDPSAPRRKLLELDWKACAELALSDLSQAHADLAPLVERLDVIRWGHAMVQPRVDFMFGGARQRAAQPWRAIYFAHSDLSGVALFEEAFDHGIRAAEAVIAVRSHRATSARAASASPA